MVGASKLLRRVRVVSYNGTWDEQVDAIIIITTIITITITVMALPSIIGGWIPEAEPSLPAHLASQPSLLLPLLPSSVLLLPLHHLAGGGPGEDLVNHRGLLPH